MNDKQLKLSNSLNDLGFSLKYSGPLPNVKGNWPNISFQVHLYFKDKLVLETPYSLGVGYVNLGKPISYSTRIYTLHFNAEEEALFYTWQRHPHAKFSNPMVQAQVATKLAIQQKIVPGLPDVLHSLILDGDAHSSHLTFEQWCNEFSYDTDSRKAKDIYDACDNIGRQLASAIPEKILNQVKVLLQDY